MRNQWIVAFSISLLSSNILPASANSTSGNKEYPYLSAQSNRSVLSKWQLAFKEYTFKDGTFSFQIPGQCPVERPRAKCGFPEPLFRSENNKNINYFDFFGGNYEIGFHIAVAEHTNLAANSDTQKALLDKKYKSSRRLMEQKRGGRLNPASTKVNVNGYDGVDLWWDGVDGEATVIVRIVVAGNRVYSLTTSVFERQVPFMSNDMLTFFNGFAIHKSTP